MHDFLVFAHEQARATRRGGDDSVQCSLGLEHGRQVDGGVEQVDGGSHQWDR
ncbi:MAG: hypothetical protein ACR2J7_01885 [Luteimonas sp.]